MKTGFIYKIQSPTGKLYIGKTINLSERMGKYSRLKCQGQPYIYNSLVKHGFNNHRIEVLILVPEEELDYWEKYYISLYNTYWCNSDKGMNCTTGGARDCQKKQRVARKTKAVHAYTLDGVYHKTYSSIEEAAKVHGATLGAIYGAIHVKGRATKKLQWSYSKYNNLPAYVPQAVGKKPIDVYYKDGAFYKSFDSSTSASKDTGVSNTSISNNLKGRSKTTSLFIFKYKHIE